jgi:outer membrane protein assembly factor BamB
MDGNMYGLDAETGEPSWAKPFTANGAMPTTALANEGSLLVGAMDRRLYAVDAASGNVAWDFEADNWFWTEPLVNNGVVYAGSLDGRMYALDPGRLQTSGDPLWSFDAESAIRSRPAVVGDTLVLASRDGHAFGLDLATGTQKWRTELGSPVFADLVAAGPLVYVKLQNGKLQSIDPATGVATDIPFGQQG